MRVCRKGKLVEARALGPGRKSTALDARLGNQKALKEKVPASWEKLYQHFSQVEKMQKAKILQKRKM